MCTDPAAELMARLREGAGAELLSSLPSYDESQTLSLSTRLREEGHDPGLVAAALTQESGGEFAVLILRVEREVPDELLESIAESLHAESFQINLN